MSICERSRRKVLQEGSATRSQDPTDLKTRLAVRRTGHSKGMADPPSRSTGSGECCHFTRASFHMPGLICKRAIRYRSATTTQPRVSGQGRWCCPPLAQSAASPARSPPTRWRWSKSDDRAPRHGAQAASERVDPASLRMRSLFCSMHIIRRIREAPDSARSHHDVTSPHGGPFRAPLVPRGANCRRISR